MNIVYDFCTYSSYNEKIKSYPTLMEAYEHVEDFPGTEYILMYKYNTETKVESEPEEVWRRLWKRN